MSKVTFECTITYFPNLNAQKYFPILALTFYYFFIISNLSTFNQWQPSTFFSFQNYNRNSEKAFKVKLNLVLSDRSKRSRSYIKKPARN